MAMRSGRGFRTCRSDATGAEEAAHSGDAHVHAAIQGVLPDAPGTHIEAGATAGAVGGGGDALAVAGDGRALAGDRSHVPPPRVRQESH